MDWENRGGIKMKTIRIESEEYLGVEPTDVVTLGKASYAITGIIHDFTPTGHRERITATESGQYTAGRMVWDDNGLTLTGAVYKYMNEMLPGCQACSQAHAERVAGRLSARLTSHIECVHSEVKRVSERLKRALALAEEREREVARLNGLIIQGCGPLEAYTNEALIHELSRRGAASTVKCDGCEPEVLRKMHEKEIEHLRSAVGKKRNKSDRLGKKIAAQNEEIHRLNELLRAIRQRYEGNNVKSFARMAEPAHVNCRCWIDPKVDVEGVIASIAKEVEERAKRLTPVFGYAIDDIPIAGVCHVSLSEPDERPYAVLCCKCGQVHRESDVYCPRCGQAINLNPEES
jgi:hypothetical protein